ncbi:hypothetical protein RchiOBHm_Chr6g0246731 [Rosa chinensis]|uniref:Uncharacterized protein n=1 Tax=Rosa chinensis TaxID=74649 RepID=A0A2P6PJM2_ROSCH|nr:hypothetical protein RchiOBHm_Chr6g0246731 [Rosa chinensis]
MVAECNEDRLVSNLERRNGVDLYQAAGFDVVMVNSSDLLLNGCKLGCVNVSSEE